MTLSENETPEIRRNRSDDDSRRLFYVGVVVGSGLLLALLHVLHIVSDVVEDMGVLALLTGAVLPLILALLIVWAGYRIYHSDMPTAHLYRIDVWFLLGFGSILLLAGTSVVYEFLEGAELSHVPYYILNFATAGGGIGILVGWYDVQNQLQAAELRVFQKAVEHGGHSVVMTTPDGSIEYANPKFEEQTGYNRNEVIGRPVNILKSGVHDEGFYNEMWGTISSGKNWAGEVVNHDSNGEEYVVNQTIAPVTDELGNVERYVAINADITEQKRRQQELERQRDELAHLNQFMTTMWDITQSLIAVSDEPTLTDGVCEVLVSTDFCENTWFSEYDPRDKILRPTVACGIDTDDIEPLPVGEDATVMTPDRWNDLKNHETIVIEGDIAMQHVSADDTERTFVVVPIIREERIWGTLHITFDKTEEVVIQERDQLATLGDTIAHALDMIKTQELLHADRLVELELRSTDETDVLVDLSTETTNGLTLEGTVPLSDDRALLYVQVDDGDIDTVRDVIEGIPDTENVRILSENGEQARIAFEVSSASSIVKSLMDVGADVVHATVEGGEGTVIAHVLPDENVRSVVEGLHNNFEQLELVAKREIERDLDLDHSLVTNLTERQRETLYAAYHAGYFESPRESTAEEIASSMGVSGPTFHKHLRRAQNQLFEGILDSNPAETVAE